MWQTASDETGKRYGSLTVIHRISTADAPNNSRKHHAYWRCKCDCGNETVSRGNDLRNGISTRCRRCRGRIGGRANAAVNSLPPGVACMHAAIASMRQNASRRRLAWEISITAAERLMTASCHYCGSPPGNAHKRRGQAFIYSGIDRVDSKLGYIEGNVVSCCRFCNTAKSNRDVDEFLEWAQRVAAHTKK